MSEKMHLNKRGKRVLTALGIAAASVVTAGLDNESGVPAKHKDITVIVDRYGEGADDIIDQVDPGANEEQRYELENTIQAQGLGSNHTLMFGQAVRVPVINEQLGQSPSHTSANK